MKSLSFEYFLDGIKIITNSGFGSHISKKAELLSRLTACQSTLNINDTSVTKFERNETINKVFGNSIQNSFKSFHFFAKNENGFIGCSASNNGYEKKFGCTHKREVYVDKEDNYLKGVDHIFKAKDGYPIRYAFRFHINPELNVIKTMSGNSALIQISKNKSLLFTISDENLKIEKLPEIICEPGRAIVAESGSTIVRVDLRKKQKLYINDGTYGTLFDAGVPNIVYP